MCQLFLGMQDLPNKAGDLLPTRSVDIAFPEATHMAAGYSPNVSGTLLPSGTLRNGGLNGPDTRLRPPRVSPS